MSNFYKNFTILSWLGQLPTPIGLIPWSSRFSTKSAIMDDDPWDWSVDRVVQELCTEDRSWSLPSLSQPRPDLVLLEQAIRDNEISGYVLLMDVDDNAIINDLGIKKLGQRSFVRCGRDAIRQKSAKWIAQHSPTVPTSVNPTTGPASTQYNAPGPPHSSWQSLISPVHTVNNSPLSNQLSPRLSVNVFQTPVQARSEERLDGPSDPKRRKLHTPEDSEQVVRSQVYQWELPADGDIRDISQLGRVGLAGTTEVGEMTGDATRPDQQPGEATDTNAKKRKRVAPILITSEIDPNRNRQLPTEADTVVFNIPKADDSVGILANEKRVTNTMAVDKLFYDDATMGEDVMQESYNFSQTTAQKPNDHRIYVKNMMQHFLLASSNASTITHNAKQYMAVVPYSTRFANQAKKQSFTLYSDTSVTIQSMSAWPEVEQLAPRVKASERADTIATLDTSGQALIGNAYDNPDILEKYNGIDDEILPLYGESDFGNNSEGYWFSDSEVELPSKQTLTHQEVEHILDGAILEMVGEWNEYKLPKCKHRAWKAWKEVQKSRRIRQDRLESLQNKLDHLQNDRIPKLRKAIAADVWHSDRLLRKTVASMEPSIYDREEILFTISILQSRTPPEKPTKAYAPRSIKKSSIDNDDGDDGESIHSDSSADDEEDLAIFIEGDAQEMNLADDEDETMSDASFVSARATVARRTPGSESLAHGAHDHPMEDAFGLPSDSKPELVVLPKSAVGTPELIDLTLISSSDDNAMAIDLITPTKKNYRSSQAQSTGSGSLSKRSPGASNDEEGELPALSNTEAALQVSLTSLSNRQDRDRLLVRAVHSFIPIEKERFFRQLKVYIGNADGLWIEMTTVLADWKSSKPDFANFCATLARLFQDYSSNPVVRFTDGLPLDLAADPPLQQDMNVSLSRLKEAKAEWFQPFFDSCFKLMNTGGESSLPGDSSTADNSALQDADVAPDDSTSDSSEAPRSANRRRALHSSTSGDEIESPTKKGKKKLVENASARENREDVQRIQAEQERRRQILQQQMLLQNGPGASADHARKIINDAKHADQGFVYVNEEIARKIKPHQLAGVKFMWNQCVSGAKSMQGCLLAHTMGLGKTMQSITLLVAIAEAAASSDPTVSSQIPKSLRISKTLILCPAGLTENWLDELLTWVPKGILGDLNKIDAQLVPHKRLLRIREWEANGGVLIIGYDMFRMIIKKKFGEGQDPGQVEMADKLLNGPNIIIADEAHKMKNAKSALAVAASAFRSTTRIALTGSPLANNIIEYHSMINWVAPNYLGPIAEFKEKFSKPIQEGLYFDSTRYEKRKSMKMLGVLNADLAPKINRADMSVMCDDLPPKKEFVITLSLTDIQKQAYEVYIKSMYEDKTEDLSNETTMWHWIAILRLLVNHPSCFMDKLNKRKEDAQIASQSQEIREEVSLEEDESPIDPADQNLKTGVSETLIKREREVFKGILNLPSIFLSNKVKILVNILAESKKVGDKVLVFSQSIPTIDYLAKMCQGQNRRFSRLDGQTKIATRQKATKLFNSDDSEVYLISSTAGALGLNLYGANRVVLFDFGWNPTIEEQAVGRAYRIGQKKPVFVYRLVTGGTFEDVLLNTTIFKQQLAFRVVDKKSYQANARKIFGDFLFNPKEVEQKDLSELDGMDVVLDGTLKSDRESKSRAICSIVQSTNFQRPDLEVLDEADEREVAQQIELQHLTRTNPVEADKRRAKYQRENEKRQANTMTSLHPNGPAATPHARVLSTISNQLPAPQLKALPGPHNSALQSGGLPSKTLDPSVRRPAALTSLSNMVFGPQYGGPSRIPAALTTQERSPQETHPSRAAATGLPEVNQAQQVNVEATAIGALSPPICPPLQIEATTATSTVPAQDSSSVLAAEVGIEAQNPDAETQSVAGKPSATPQDGAISSPVTGLEARKVSSLNPQSTSKEVLSTNNANAQPAKMSSSDHSFDKTAIRLGDEQLDPRSSSNRPINELTPSRSINPKSSADRQSSKQPNSGSVSSKRILQTMSTPKKSSIFKKPSEASMAAPTGKNRSMSANPINSSQKFAGKQRTHNSNPSARSAASDRPSSSSSEDTDGDAVRNVGKNSDYTNGRIPSKSTALRSSDAQPNTGAKTNSPKLARSEERVQVQEMQDARGDGGTPKREDSQPSKVGRSRGAKTPNSSSIKGSTQKSPRVNRFKN